MNSTTMKTSRQQKIQQMFEGFMAMQRALGSRKDGFFQKYNLTRAQVQILYAVAHDQAVTIKGIAKKMGMTSSAATQMIEGLVTAGFVQRVHDKNDRRIVHLQFSEKGKKQFDAFKKDHMNRISKTFEVLNDKELDVMISIPKKVLQKLESTNN